MPLFTAIYEADLPPRAVLVYCNLKDRANKEEGIAFPSIGRIARDTGLSRSSVKRSIADLEKCGLLVKEYQWRDNGSRTVNHYRLIR